MIKSKCVFNNQGCNESEPEVQGPRHIKEFQFLLIGCSESVGF